MTRYLENREDYIWLRHGHSSQDTSRNDQVQSVFDQLNRLGLLQKDGENKSNE